MGPPQVCLCQAHTSLTAKRVTHIYYVNLSLQAATRLVEEIEAMFDYEVSSGNVTDRTRDILHKTKDVLNSLITCYEKQKFKVQQLNKVHCSCVCSADLPAD